MEGGRRHRLPRQALRPSEASRGPQAKHVAILVPYRDNAAQDRAAQLAAFMKHFAKLPEFRVYVVEQSQDGRRFNRGALLNVGTLYALKSGADALVYHDVDLLPLAAALPYYRAYPESPIHIGRIWRTKYDYDGFLGGILSISKKHALRINGFPNHFWGWGGEDDALSNRLARAGIAVWEPTITQGLKELPHALTQSDTAAVNPRKWEDRNEDSSRTGLRTVRFELMHIEHPAENIAKITVHLKE